MTLDHSSTRDLIILPDNRIVSWNNNGRCIVWKHNGTIDYELDICDLILLKDGRVINFANRCYIDVWDINKRKSEFLVCTDEINHIAKLCDRRLVSLHTNNIMRIWDLKNEGQCIRQFNIIETHVLSIHVHGIKVMVRTQKGNIGIYNTETGIREMQLNGSSYINSMIVGDNIITGCEDHTIKIWV